MVLYYHVPLVSPALSEMEAGDTLIQNTTIVFNSIKYNDVSSKKQTISIYWKLHLDDK